MYVRRLVAATIAAGLTSTTLIATAPSTAHAESGHAALESAVVAKPKLKGCVTKKEYKKAKVGMSQKTVEKQIFKAKGIKSGKGQIIGVGYRACGKKNGAVGVAYQKKQGKYRLASKSAQW